LPLKAAHFKGTPKVMKNVNLTVQLLTRDAFAPFGIVIDQRGSVEINLGGGVPSMTGATAERRPFEFNFMARHRRTMQVFSPLVGSQAIIAVAPPSDHTPRPEDVRAFFIDGRHPYALHAGTWHTPPFPTGEWASYLVVDRAGTLEDDYELHDFSRTDDLRFMIDV
jgi:ureidoglycolate lyase